MSPLELVFFDPLIWLSLGVLLGGAIFLFWGFLRFQASSPVGSWGSNLTRDVISSKDKAVGLENSSGLVNVKIEDLQTLNRLLTEFKQNLGGFEKRLARLEGETPKKEESSPRGF